MSRISTASWGYITGDVSSFAYRPLYGVHDVVYRNSQYNMAAGANATLAIRPYKVVAVTFKTNSSGVPLKQDGTTTITGAVGAQADAPWLYDLQEILSGQTVATASGEVVRDVREDGLSAIAALRTLVGTEVSDGWADPAAA